MNQQSNQNKMFNFSFILLCILLIITKSDSITLDGLGILLSGSSGRAMNTDTQECGKSLQFEIEIFIELNDDFSNFT